MKPYRILVCGSNYGQAYVEAVRAAPWPLQLAGILGSGSLRSRELARKCGVPFHQSVYGLKGNVDIACAAMGRSGADVVLRLLEQGIHVLCEHPQTPDFIDSALNVAASNGACFHVNGHFASLKAASAFIERSALLRQSADPLFVDAMTTDRSLYGALDILRRVTKKFEPYELVLLNQFSPFTVVQAALGGIPTTFQVQGSVRAGVGNLRDGDPGYLVDHRIAIGFPHGILTLASIAGPVIWNRNCNSALPAGSGEPMWSSIYGESVNRAEFHKQRIEANLDSLRSLVERVCTGGIPAEQTREHLLEVSRAWHRIGTCLNQACPVERNAPHGS